IPILVMDCKRRNNLYVHTLPTDPETDVRGRSGTLFQIDGTLHRRQFFDYTAKVNKFPYMFPYIPKKVEKD
ncbi:MAG: hypothetical protein KHX48_12380, partial [Alistipes sp.]|nr:hypothetical protein [Alistipes sp.]